MATLTERLRDCLERIKEEAEEREDVEDRPDGYSVRANPYMIIAEEAREALALLNRLVTTNANT